ncbi:MAG: radical SAM/SPASM domain-containing protein [Candidatus Omnitrophica bacterium]|nr:radical SAM/SPASM domain-containing protein [Candidatus Omnitrophota bacterium]
MAIPISNDMRFEVTTRCNYNCIICPRDKITRKIETMSLELFKQLFDKVMSETNQYNTLTFPGMGEPLLDSGLEDKIKYAKGRNPKMDALILTNGSLLTLDRFKAFQDLGVQSIRVSIYGHDSESYARAHGIANKAMYKRVKDAIEAICKIKKNTQILLTYNIIQGINSSLLNSWIEFWKDKVDLLEVWHPHNWVDGRNYRQVQSEMNHSCSRPSKGPLQVQVDGTVNMCCFDFDGKLTLGDLKTQSLNEIFSSEAFLKIKSFHDSGNFSQSHLICEHCDQRNQDKSNVAVFNSRFDLKERVNQISTTYRSLD